MGDWFNGLWMGIIIGFCCGTAFWVYYYKKWTKTK